MSIRELVILGTSSQVPTSARNQNGYFLRWDKFGFLFDPGEGTQRQMIHADVTASSITHILLSHFHGDHCLGLPGVVQRVSMDKVPHAVRCIFPAYGEKFFDNLCAASIFVNNAKIEKHTFNKPGLVVDEPQFTIETQKVEHSVECWGYRISERDSVTMKMRELRELGISGPDVGLLKRQGFLKTKEHGTLKLEDFSDHKAGQSFAFILDTRPCENAIKLAKGVDLMVCESTYHSDESQEASLYMHMTAAEAARLAKSAGVKKLVLTHFSQRYRSLVPLLKEACEIFPNTVLAKDGDHIPIERVKRADA